MNQSFSAAKEYAVKLDEVDTLASFRNEFYFPKQPDGTPFLYFCGHSLGLEPKRTKENILEECDSWATRGVEGHFHGEFPWYSAHETVTKDLAQLVGAKESEVVAMNSLTTNLHLLFVSFFQPQPKRSKIMIEATAFPSDRYLCATQLQHHGFDPQTHLLEWAPRTDTMQYSCEDLEILLQKHGDEIALIFLGHVNYLTGQAFDLKRIAKLAQKYGCVFGVDLAHGIGNLHLLMHDDGVDFAAWCSYKYLNSGPGGIAGIFVHEKHHQSDLPRWGGWWGHNKDTRFQMAKDFQPMVGAEGWQLSNPPIFQLTALRSSLSVYREAGIANLKKKSLSLTNYLENLLQSEIKVPYQQITPTDPNQRGCQISIRFPGKDMKSVQKTLQSKGVLCDVRSPDILRIAPVPLYNSHVDVWTLIQKVKEQL